MGKLGTVRYREHTKHSHRPPFAPETQVQTTAVLGHIGDPIIIILRPIGVLNNSDSRHNLSLIPPFNLDDLPPTPSNLHDVLPYEPY